MATVAEKTEFVFPDEAEEKKKKDGETPPPEETPAVTEEAEGDIAVEVVDDTPEEDRGRKVGVSKDIEDVTDEELATHSANVQKRLKELSFARHDERRAKEAALRERQEAERMAQSVLEENKRLKEYVTEGEKTYQGTAKAAATAKLEMAKRKFKEAHEAFDADALIAAQQELTTAQLELVAAENFRPLQIQPEGVYRQPTEQVQPDPRVLDWKQKNPWFGSDEPMTAYALGLHQKLVRSGVDPRTDEYYRRLNADLHQTFPKVFTQDPEDRPPASQPHRKPATVVAPTSRSSSAKKVTLTQTQVNLARKFGLTNEEYAKHVALLETNNGR